MTLTTKRNIDSPTILKLLREAGNTDFQQALEDIESSPIAKDIGRDSAADYAMAVCWQCADLYMDELPHLATMGGFLNSLKGAHAKLGQTIQTIEAELTKGQKPESP